MMVQGLDGVPMNVTVPPGLNPGQEFQFQAPTVVPVPVLLREYSPSRRIIELVK